MPKVTQNSKQKVVAELRRNEIISAAKKIFASKGYDATSMDEIAKQAQLAKGTLYLYFDSKDAIYQAVVQYALNKLSALTEEHVNQQPGFPAKLAAFISIRIAFWHEHQQLYRIILSINREGQHRKRSIAWQQQAVQYLRDLYEQAANAGEIPQQDLLAAAWTTMDAVRGVNERRTFPINSDSTRSTEDDARFLTAFLLNALQARSR